jgi:hypothetical protein
MTRNRVSLALALAASLLSSRALLADVRADEKTRVEFAGMLGRMVNLFGGKAAREGVTSTVAVKGDRKATLGDTTGQIVDLAEEKVYDLDMKKKTYKVTTFAELRRRMEEAKNKAEQDAKREQAAEKTDKEKPAESPKPAENNVEFDFDVKNTGEKKTINGFDTHEVVMTVTVREKGKTLDEGGGLVLTADSWLGPKISAMKEITDFEMRYAQKLYGPMITGASPEEMAAAAALYPMMAPAIGRLRAEGTKVDGTAVLTTLTFEGVKSAAQMAEEQKQRDAENKQSASGKGVGGLAGGLMRRVVQKKMEGDLKARTTVMTGTTEVLKVVTDVGASDVAVPAGFKENR